VQYQKWVQTEKILASDSILLGFYADKFRGASSDESPEREILVTHVATAS
jgi:hypothetical protein